jgi:membrane fusion protein (multidrug efflux system)
MATPSEPASSRPARRRAPRKGWLVAGVLLVVAVGGYAYLARPWDARPTPVAVEIVTEGPVSQVLAVNGRVIARDTVKVRSAVSGQAVDVGPQEGASVAAGDVLLRLDAAQATALVNQARAALDAVVVNQQQARANAERARALGDNATRSAREDAELALTAADNEVARLQAALDQAQSQLNQYTITAPLDGVVLTRSVERGQLVDPQSELFTIADLSQLLVETDVDELYSSRIGEGLKALLQPVGDSVARHGTVVFAAPRVDPATGGRAVRIAFDEPAELPVGLTVNANIIVSETEAALSIPRGAIITEGAQSHVMVISDGLATKREIEFSDWPAGRVIVTSGLAEGDSLILDPATVAGEQPVVAR